MLRVGVYCSNRHEFQEGIRMPRQRVIVIQIQTHQVSHLAHYKSSPFNSPIADGLNALSYVYFH
jgi:hypothetical protein